MLQLKYESTHPQQGNKNTHLEPNFDPNHQLPIHPILKMKNPLQD
jgi:hypothetical protein